MDSHHLPEGTHCLANRPGSLDRRTFQIGPRGRTRTCHLSVLSGTSLLIGLHAVGAHGRICTDTVRVLSAPSLRWTTWAFQVKNSERRMQNVVRARLGAPVSFCILHSPFCIQKWCRVRELASQDRHKMDARNRMFAVANRGPPQPLRSERSVSCSWTNAA